MGSGMAANLVKVGHTVTVYNRTKERTEPLVALGAKSAKNLADACRGDAVFRMLANDDAVKSVTLQRQRRARTSSQGCNPYLFKHDQR
jgi:3-hydroxyisobutyrate dehydrogenase-like beta-hydroxyacid dehydrogenase